MVNNHGFLTKNHQKTPVGLLSSRRDNSAWGGKKNTNTVRIWTIRQAFGDVLLLGGGISGLFSMQAGAPSKGSSFGANGVKKPKKPKKTGLFMKIVFLNRF